MPFFEVAFLGPPWGAFGVGLGPPDFFKKLGMVLTSMTLEYLKIEFLQILGMVPPPLNSVPHYLNIV